MVVDAVVVLVFEVGDFVVVVPDVLCVLAPCGGLVVCVLDPCVDELPWDELPCCARTVAGAANINPAAIPIAIQRFIWNLLRAAGARPGADRKPYTTPSETVSP